MKIKEPIEFRILQVLDNEFLVQQKEGAKWKDCETYVDCSQVGGFFQGWVEVRYDNLKDAQKWLKYRKEELKREEDGILEKEAKEQKRRLFEPRVVE